MDCHTASRGGVQCLGKRVKKKGRLKTARAHARQRRRSEQTSPEGRSGRAVSLAVSQRKKHKVIISYMASIEWGKREKEGANIT